MLRKDFIESKGETVLVTNNGMVAEAYDRSKVQKIDYDLVQKIAKFIANEHC